MPPGQDSLVIIVDYKSATLRTNPSISVAAKVLTILQQHYVERLGRAIVVNLPFILSFFYKGISPFLDPITRDKFVFSLQLVGGLAANTDDRMRFNPDLKELIPDDHLWIDFGGSFNYEFEPKEYWNSLISYVPTVLSLQRAYLFLIENVMWRQTGREQQLLTLILRVAPH